MMQGSFKVTVESDVMIRMRDGIHLATDIYHPEAGESCYPVILERTPYNKLGISRTENSLAAPTPRLRSHVALELASHGYVVVLQDCRGRYHSEGIFTKYLNEAEDGYDTLTWLLQQPWCNGRVGTMGLSYGAHTQCALSCLNPPGLACMFMDSGGFSSAYHGGIRRGGAFELKQATWAYKHALLSPETMRDPARQAALEAENITAWFQDMPWRPGHSPLRHAPEYEDYLFELWQHGLFDDYWKQPGLYAEGFYDQFPDVPIAIIGSWYDPYVRTCLTNFSELGKRKKSAMLLIMGPWTHGNRSCTFAGNVDFGSQSTLDDNIADDYATLRLQWFNRALKVTPDTQTNDRQVHYFTMGGSDGRRNRAGRMQHGGFWQHSSQWPPASVTMQNFYLHREGLLNTTKPIVTEAWQEYVFDPSDPVPTIGGALTSGDPVMTGGAFDQRYRNGKFGFDNSDASRPLAERKDVLVFQSEPLASDLVITGEVEAHLWISSDCPDTDFTVKLIDVYPPGDDYPDGYAMNITDGIIRARYHQGWDKEALLERRHIYKLIVQPFASSNLFQKGHRLRIDISSSNFPHFDINPNTGAPEGVASKSVVATNRIYCDKNHPSVIRMAVQTDFERVAESY